MTNDSLAKAITYLGAVEVAPEKAAVKHGDHWYIAPSSDLDEYANADHRSRAFIAATWKILPAWWSLEQRFAWRNLDGEHDNGERYTSFADARNDAAFDASRPLTSRITADLDTGAEVPA